MVNLTLTLAEQKVRKNGYNYSSYLKRHYYDTKQVQLQRIAQLITTIADMPIQDKKDEHS